MPDHGLVLGKFMPPHRGHLYLVDFAKEMTPDLTVVVGSLAAEPIPGALRHAWMSELYPTLEVVHLQDENPQTPDQHPDFWAIWKASLERAVGRPIDVLFASEDYGKQLAEVLGARFVPSNALRSILSVSGTEVRRNPIGHWSHLPPSVQSYYGRRVLIFGPESTGKTTLASRLAQEFCGLVVPEYARTYLQGRESSFTIEDMAEIAQGQRASEEALARAGNPLLFCDTDPLTTMLWCQELFGELPEGLSTIAEHDEYDLILLLDVDVPWVEGTLRLRPQGRQSFLDRCREALEKRGRDYLLVSGSWEERFAKASQAVRSLLEQSLSD